MKERFYRVLAGIAAPMAFWIFVLGFNLFFLTPKRMYEDKVKEVEKTRLESQSIHYTVRPMASGRPDWNGGLEIIVHSSSDIVPFGLAFTTDKPVINGTTRIVEFHGDASFRFDSPVPGGYWVQARNGIHPGQPWIITMFGKEPFAITRTQRMDH